MMAVRMLVDIALFWVQIQDTDFYDPALLHQTSITDNAPIENASLTGCNCPVTDLVFHLSAQLREGLSILRHEYRVITNPSCLSFSDDAPRLHPQIVVFTIAAKRYYSTELRSSVLCLLHFSKQFLHVVFRSACFPA